MKRHGWCDRTLCCPDRCLHRLLGGFFRLRDGADGGESLQDPRPRARGEPARAQGDRTDAGPRAADRCHSRRQQPLQHRRGLDGDVRLHGAGRRSRSDLRDRGDDGPGGDLRRGAAQDLRDPQRGARRIGGGPVHEGGGLGRAAGHARPPGARPPHVPAGGRARRGRRDAVGRGDSRSAGALQAGGRTGEGRARHARRRARPVPGRGRRGHDPPQGHGDRQRRRPARRDHRRGPQEPAHAHPVVARRSRQRGRRAARQGPPARAAPAGRTQRRHRHHGHRDRTLVRARPPRRSPSSSPPSASSTPTSPWWSTSTAR